MLFGLFAICTLFYTASVHSASLDAEKSSESVKLKLYQYSSQEWVANDKASSLQTRLAADANSYCDSSPTLCGLLYWDNLSVFSSANVGITPVDKKKNMEIEVYITLPNGANVSSVSTTAFVLNKAATYAIVTANKDGIETAIGLTVTYIDTTYYGIPISVKENQIIIPIAIVFVLILIIVVIAMHMWQKRRTKKGRQLRKQENRFKTGRVSPGKEAAQTIK